jgi:hypothetical protein
MEKQKARAENVYDRVTAQFQDQDVRELWQRIRSELIRPDGGPDACITYLESELARIHDVIRRGLNRLG